MCDSRIVFGVRIFSLFERPVKYGESSVISYRNLITKSVPQEVDKNAPNIADSEKEKEADYL